MIHAYPFILPPNDADGDDRMRTAIDCDRPYGAQQAPNEIS